MDIKADTDLEDTRYCCHKMKLVAINTNQSSVLSPAAQMIVNIFLAINYFLIKAYTFFSTMLQ